MQIDPFDTEFVARLSSCVGDKEAGSFCAAVVAFKGILSVIKKIESQERIFSQFLGRASKTVRRVERNSNGNSDLIYLSADANGCINDAIDGIRKLISEANEVVNSVDISDLSCPLCVCEIFNRFNDILPKLGTDLEARFSLGALKKIRELLGDVTIGPVLSFVCRYRREFESFRAELNHVKIGISAFNEWIHDMGHYLVQIDKILPNRSSCDIQISRSDVLTLDGLLSGVRSLMIGLQLSLRGDDSITSLIDEEKKHPYEPYKVFHKMRYCFDDKQIAWEEGENKFWGKVSPASGIEFVAMNLYSNAVKYLSRFRGEKTISTFFRQHQDGLEILVESYGPMINEEELQRISYQVYRASSAGSYKGSGRGLLRVRKICEAAGYKFYVFTRNNKAKHGFAPFVARIIIPKQYQVEVG